jgi:hypothetical protein
MERDRGGWGGGERERDFFGHLLLVFLGYSIQRNLLAVDKYHHLLFLFHELILWLCVCARPRCVCPDQGEKGKRRREGEGERRREVERER